jgi:acyl carrier protein
METEAKIVAAVLEIVQRNTPSCQAITADQSLLDDLGLESMDLAELVATLEVELGSNPFAESVAISDVRTVADLCAAYRG